nr:MAG TPA: hypothetical protein [Caudoviricetes sp.]
MPLEPGARLKPLEVPPPKGAFPFRRLQSGVAANRVFSVVSRASEFPFSVGMFLVRPPKEQETESWGTLFSAAPTLFSYGLEASSPGAFSFGGSHAHFRTH